VPIALYIGNMLSGELASQEHLGALVVDHLGLAGMEATRSKRPAVPVARLCASAPWPWPAASEMWSLPPA